MKRAGRKSDKGLGTADEETIGNMAEQFRSVDSVSDFLYSVLYQGKDG